MNLDIVYIFTNPNWRGIKFYNKKDNYDKLSVVSDEIFITDISSISRVEWENDINTYDNKIVEINTQRGVCTCKTIMVSTKKFEEIINTIVYSKDKDCIFIDIRSDNIKILKKSE